MGVLAAALIGFGMGGEADVTPYLLSRYFGLRSFSVLYGLTWTFYAVAGALGPILMGKAFDVTGSYEALLVRLALGTLAVAVADAVPASLRRPPAPLYGSGAAGRHRQGRRVAAPLTAGLPAEWP